MQTGLPWVEKYRPTSLADLSEQSYVTDTVLKLVDEGQMPHLLFYGPPGTGKTTTILAIARHCYGEQVGQMTLELNASDDRGIGVVRDEIQAFASSQRFFTSGFKLVVLDECDNMTKDAQFALRRIIEKYTRHTRFCLIANYTSKIIPALQSRCMRFRFSPFDAIAAKECVSAVADAEGVPATEEALSAIVAVSCGDLRRACNLLQSCAMSSPLLLDEDMVYMMSGSLKPDEVATLFETLLNDSLSSVVTSFRTLIEGRGISLANILPLISGKVFGLHMNSASRAIILKALADVEVALTQVSSETSQMRSLVSSFVMLRHGRIHDSAKG